MTAVGPAANSPTVSWLRTETADVVEELQTIHGRLRDLARHLEADADRAPYPHMTRILRDLAAGEQENVRGVAARLAALGRHADDGADGIRGEARNAWERLVHLQDAYRELLRQLKVLAVRWEGEHPEDAALVARLRDGALASRAIVGDLLARADPHALN